jgi:methyl-accepting chemotaxis protein
MPDSAPASLSAPTAAPRGLGITLKIALAFAAIGALATIAAAASAYFLYGAQLEDAAARRLDAVRALMAGRVEAEIDALNDSVRTAGELLNVNLPVDGLIDPQVTRAILQTVAKQIPGARLALIDASGSPVAASEGNPEARRLAEVRSRLSRDGRVTWLESGAFAPEPALGALHLLTKAPDGPAVLIEISFSGITRLLAPNDAAVLGATGEAYLVDGAGNRRSPLRAGTGPDRIQTEGVRHALGGATGSLAYPNYAGIPVIGSAAKLKSDSLPWALLAEQAQEEALGPARQAAATIFAIGGLAILLVVFLGIAFAKWLTRPLVAIRETVARIARGDESARAPVESSDEIGQLAASFNRMVEERNAAKERVTTENRRLQASIQDLLLVVADASEGRLSVRARRAEGVLGNVGDALNRMLGNVGILIGQAKDASAQVDAAAGEISSSAGELAEGTARQGEQTTRTLQDVETLTNEARAVAENSRDAADAAARARLAAEAGARAARDAEAFMERLRADAAATARKIARLGDRSQEISGIVRSIGDISAEVDVLAMNASIEAARAGEQGKGFTIVADQVRALADRARLAAVEIEKLVAGIQAETAEAVRQIDEQNRAVDEGVRQVASAGQSLGNIVEASVDSATLADQISQSARAQEERARQAAAAVADIHRIAQDAAGRMSEFRETSARLAALSGQLNAQLENFQVGPGEPAEAAG